MCDFCKGETLYQDIDTGFSYCEIKIDESGVMHVDAGLYNEGDCFSFQINFCPYCGRKLGDAQC